MFEEPVLQTLQMFVGEILCWLPVLVMRLRKGDAPAVEAAPLLGKKRITSFKQTLFLATPAVLDFTATTLLNVGLLYTPVSIYQMVRGSIILFVGLFSVLWLKRTITTLEWLSLFVVVFGVFIVGLSGSLSSAEESDSSAAFNGDMLFGLFIIVVGIMFNALQFVVEEKALASLEVSPLEVVGYEGMYGAAVTFATMCAGHLLGHRTRADFWDMGYAFQVMFTNGPVLVSSLLIMVCISTFNFSGVSLTHTLSATSRSTIDTSRTLLVWLVSLALGWEQFKTLQLLGFSLLLYGTLVFNGVIEAEKSRLLPNWLKQRSTQPLITIDEPLERF
ncbi:hypothetical protein OGAPHI_000947 [Ogataea philodendri]|uniref:Uncharacterized protein n=1 Tax=Ogataea philodendri TaxID=1378263 RepID=A0A9P8PEK9_9ASCO|nr:uncharacterized protein OGAPHI_000947 [Ogataea philodendri]KAH3670432.1 hypothetical protein OGAPHI_000947 [Ogataea philodendri]